MTVGVDLKQKEVYGSASEKKGALAGGKGERFFKGLARGRSAWEHLTWRIQ